MGIYVKSGLVEMFKKYVYVEYDSEAPKRRSPNIGERRANVLKKNTFFFFIWNGAHRCLVNTVLSLLRHTQCEHDFRRFSIIRCIHKTLFEIINSFQNHTKKTIPKTHQTSVSVTPNAFQPLWKWASPCSFAYFFIFF